jgi:hypothetical protein
MAREETHSEDRYVMALSRERVFSDPDLIAYRDMETAKQYRSADMKLFKVRITIVSRVED